MCLIFISVQQHPQYKLIVAANRDEFYERKTTAAGFWNDHPHVLAGRDLEAGGTWMGIHKNGRIAMVTNYRDLRNLKTVAPSRGALVSDFLTGNDTAKKYLENITHNSNQYNGFNLIVGSTEELWYHSNYKEGVQPLTPGLHGLSNHLLDTPWPKVSRGLTQMQQVLVNNAINPDDLFALLSDGQLASDDQLPDTGIGVERERMLSSMFIKSPGYGTRCSTVVLIDRHDEVYFCERVYDVQTFEYRQQVFSFTIEK